MTAASEKGKRPIRGGRAGVRSILFLVAAIAARYDESLGRFRDRLLAAGKEKMVVRIALARKLLVRLNAKARDARAALRQCNLTNQIVAHPDRILRCDPTSPTRGEVTF